MKAVIMAGGFGTRLRPLTCNLPKPMAPMANRPMMEHIVELLAKHHITDLISMLYFSPEDIRGYFEDGHRFGVSMQYFTPSVDMGTAGCVKFAEGSLSSTFVVISGDVLTDFDLTAAIEYHKQKGSAATIVLTRVPNPLQYGVVIIDENGKINRFLEKPSWGEVFSDTVNTGIYILDESVLKQIPDKQQFDFSKDLFPKLLKENVPLYGYVAQGYWKDVGDLREYRLGHRDILDGKVTVKIPGKKVSQESATLWLGENVVIEENVNFVGTNIIGNNSRIARGCKIDNCVIGDNVTIGAVCDMSNSVIWDEVTVGPECVARETVIGEGARIGQKALLQIGSIIGDECLIGTEAQIRPNVKIWPHKVLEDGAVLASSLIWGEKWTRSLFGAHGISGLGNIEITPDFAAKVGAAYGAYLGKGSYVITSRDAHKASRMIKRAFNSGLVASGVTVGDIKTSPVPVVRYEMGQEGEAGGAHVRQSPFDSRLIDIKIFDRNGADITFQQEKAIEQLFLREDFKRLPIDDTGEILALPGSQDYYRAGFLKTINQQVLRKAKLKIVIDYAYSSASLVFPAILGELGLEVVALNSYLDPKKITKTHEEFEHSLEQLSSIVTTLKADMGFLIDNGAEKLFMIDENGKVITDSQALVAVSFLAMQSYKDGTIALPVNQHSCIEKLAPAEIKVVRIPTMPRHIVSASRLANVRFVGDGIGGFIFPEFQANFDAMYAIAKILELLAAQNKRIGQLIRQHGQNIDVAFRRIPCPWDKKGQVMRMAYEFAKNCTAETIEGVKIYTKDGWVLMVPDLNAAYFNLWAEAETPQKAQELLNDYCNKVTQWVSQ